MPTATVRPTRQGDAPHRRHGRIDHGPGDGTGGAGYQALRRRGADLMKGEMSNSETLKARFARIDARYLEIEAEIVVKKRCSKKPTQFWVRGTSSRN
jgi:hypothetical protein